MSVPAYMRTTASARHKEKRQVHQSVGDKSENGLAKGERRLLQASHSYGPYVEDEASDERVSSDILPERAGRCTVTVRFRPPFEGEVCQSLLPNPLERRVEYRPDPSRYSQFDHVLAGTASQVTPLARENQSYGSVRIRTARFPNLWPLLTPSLVLLGCQAAVYRTLAAPIVDDVLEANPNPNPNPNPNWMTYWRVTTAPSSLMARRAQGRPTASWTSTLAGNHLNP